MWFLIMAKILVSRKSVIFVARILEVVRDSNAQKTTFVAHRRFPFCTAALCHYLDVLLGINNDSNAYRAVQGVFLSYAVKSLFDRQESRILADSPPSHSGTLSFHELSLSTRFTISDSKF
jgi:hypothetical protein